MSRLVAVRSVTTPEMAVNVPNAEVEVKLPNGKSQKDEIIRVDYERNLRDAGELARLAEEVKDDLEKGDRYLVSSKTLKKLDDVEKLSKDIRQRLRRN